MRSVWFWLLVCSGIVQAQPSISLTSSSFDSAVFARARVFAKIEQADYDASLRTIYIPLMASFDVPMHGPETQDQDYQSMTALGLFDCTNQLFTTVDHRFKSLPFAAGKTLGWDAAAPQDLQWLWIDLFPSIKEIYMKAQHLCAQ